MDVIYQNAIAQPIYIEDLLTEFNVDRRSSMLDYLDNRAEVDGAILEIFLDYDPRPFKSNYKNLRLKAMLNSHSIKKVSFFRDYQSHPSLEFKNFICSFNGTPHVSRQLLTAILKKYKWYTPASCSQCFTVYPDKIDGYIDCYLPDEERIYRKFFVPESELEGNQINYEQFDHASNIKTLEVPLTQSFLHIVSESMATSYCPNVSEKCFYSIVTRGLFLAFAPPGWHKMLVDLYGFKLYSKLFDYKFDEIDNPVKRLVELTSMISKYSHLSMSELHDLYLIELDAINYNYNHYHSGDYITVAKNLIESYNSTV